MKRTESGKWKWGLLLPLPLLLIASGVCMTVHIFRRCQQVIQQHESHEALLAALEPEAFSLLIYGGLIMAGMCLLVMLCLREKIGGHIVRVGCLVCENLDL